MIFSLGSDGPVYSKYYNWFAVVIPFKEHQTANPTRPFSGNVSKAQKELDPSVGTPILLDNEIIGWRSQDQKSSVQSSCALSLVNTGIDWRKRVFPSDWVMLWAFDNEADFLSTRAKVLAILDAATGRGGSLTEPTGSASREGFSPNQFKDGLKFVGKIHGVKRIKQTDQRTGKRTIAYRLTAIAFSELASRLYFNQYLLGAIPGNEDYEKLTSFYALLIGQDQIGKAFKAQSAIPMILKAIFGIGQAGALRGVVSRSVEGGGNNSSLAQAHAKQGFSGNTLTGNVNEAFRVPALVTKLLGVTGPKIKSRPSMLDILSFDVGIPYFGDLGKIVSNRYVSSSEIGKGLNRASHKSIRGDFTLIPNLLDSVSVWSIVKSYLNEPINEAYTSLRVDAEGYVVPTITIRQIPFTSRWLRDSANIKSTPFIELPSWYLNECLVSEEDLGSSDAGRTNYVHMIGQRPGSKSAALDMNEQMSSNPPAYDVEDIKRNGMRPQIVRLSADSMDYNGKKSVNGTWTALYADAVMDVHLRHSGAIVCAGIQEPVPVGDNLIYGNSVYHIEGVIHQGSISRGIREFNTTFQVSFGVSTLSYLGTPMEQALRSLGHDFSGAGSVPRNGVNVYPSQDFRVEAHAPIGLTVDCSTNSGSMRYKPRLDDEVK